MIAKYRFIKLNDYSDMFCLHLQTLIKLCSVISGFFSADPARPGVCSSLLALLSMLLVMVTLPASLFLCIKVVQEYERAVIFRLGRLRPGGAKGPGIFFVMPCIDSYKKVDLRTVSFDVPPQEVLAVL